MAKTQAIVSSGTFFVERVRVGSEDDVWIYANETYRVVKTATPELFRDEEEYTGEYFAPGQVEFQIGDVVEVKEFPSWEHVIIGLVGEVEERLCRTTDFLRYFELTEKALAAREAR